MSHYLITFLSALTDASALFVAAAGLTLVFGALRIINIAHGSFYAFGAFGVTTLVGAATGGWRFWVALVAVPLAVAALGGVTEITVLRRVYAKDHLAQLVVTYALFLIFGDIALRLWGSAARSVPVPAATRRLRHRSGPASSRCTTCSRSASRSRSGSGCGHCCSGPRWAGGSGRRSRTGRLLASAGHQRAAAVHDGVRHRDAAGRPGGGARRAARVGLAGAGREHHHLRVHRLGDRRARIGRRGRDRRRRSSRLFNTAGVLWAPTWEPAFIYLAMIAVLALRPWGLLGTAER